MFSFNLPYPHSPSAFYTPEGVLKFHPPVYEQRYATVIKILEHPDFDCQFKKVVDFGCAEMRLLSLLKRTTGVEHIVEVDTDETVLNLYQHRAVPLITEHLIQREHPLRIEIFKGSIDASVECLQNTDAVVAIEIIEHLYPDVLENIPYNIFGFIQPKIALFSTPNAEFNVLFTPLGNGFRHHDHKFEWTREQFNDWALNICDRFPNYRVAVFGVGDAPPDKPEVGQVTQFALFVRRDILDMPLITELESVAADTSPDKQYEEVYAIDYPVHHDDRTLDQKILDEATYYINQYRTFELYHNMLEQVYRIPFQRLLEAVATVTNSAEELERVLQANGYTLQDGYIVVPQDDPDRMQRRWSNDGYDSHNEFEYFYDEEEDDDEANSSNLTNGHNHDDDDGEKEEDEEEECWD